MITSGVRGEHNVSPSSIARLREQERMREKYGHSEISSDVSRASNGLKAAGGAIGNTATSFVRNTGEALNAAGHYIEKNANTIADAAKINNFVYKAVTEGPGIAIAEDGPEAAEAGTGLLVEAFTK